MNEVRPLSPGRRGQEHSYTTARLLKGRLQFLRPCLSIPGLVLGTSRPAEPALRVGGGGNARVVVLADL